MKKTIITIICSLLLTMVAPFAYAYAPSNSARAVCLLHADTGAVLYEQNADERMLIASTTKVMTALVALEYCDPDDTFVVPYECTAVEGSSMYLKAGESYTVRDMLYGLLLVSGNDAALALAFHTAGSAANFAVLMNQKAEELGLENTSFANPHGLDAENHYSSARDLAIIMKAAMENETFREICGSKTHTVGEQTYINHNKLLWQYEGVTGGKTGYTMAAGRSLITSAERDGVRLICVTLNDSDDWDDHKALYNWIFGEYEYKSVIPVGEYTRIPVVSGESDSVGVAPDGDLRILIRKNTEPLIKLEIPRFVFADVKAGAYAGTLSVIYDGVLLGQVGLCYIESVDVNPGVRLSPWERFRWTLEMSARYPLLLTPNLLFF